MQTRLVFICALLAISHCDSHFSRDEDERDGRLADRLNDLDDRRPGGGPGGDGPGDRRPGDGPLGNRDPPRRDGGDGERPERPERVWTFALTVDNPPFAFMDNDHVVGLGIDLIHEACEMADQECEFMYLRPEAANLCWDHERATSAGLWNRWWDGCLNYEVTMDRYGVNGFTRSYARDPPAAVYKRANDNLIADDLRREDNELSVGYVGGSVRSPLCLRTEAGMRINSDLVQRYRNEMELVEALRMGDVRVGVMAQQEVDPNVFTMLDTGDAPLRCAMRGPAIMTRKDNRELLHWLNHALEEIMNSNEYSRSCYIWSQISGMDTMCEMDDDRMGGNMGGDMGGNRGDGRNGM